VETLRRGNLAREDVWTQAMVRRRGRVACEKGVQDQLAEKVFVKGLADLGAELRVCNCYEVSHDYHS